MSAYSEDQKYDRVVPLVITLGVHALIFLILFLYVIHTPLPPFPEPGGGLEVALGTMDVGMGDDPINPAANPKNASASSSPADDNNVITNDAEDNKASIPPNKKVKDKTIKKPVDKDVEKKTKPEDDELSKVLNDYNSKASKTGGHGDDNSPGFKGDPNGTPGSKNYTGTPGDGTGPGQGPGTGPGAHLSHRHLVVPATLVSNEQEEGIVVVNITVDKDGNVIDAQARAKGSTTTSSVLWAKARQAALKAKFDKSPDGTPEQHGTYVFRFSFK